MTFVVLGIAAPLAFLLILGFIPFERLITRLQTAIRQRQEQRHIVYRAAYPAHEPGQGSYLLEIFHGHEPAVAESEPTEDQHRLREEIFWRGTIRKQRNLNRLTGVAAVAAIAAFVVLWLQLRDTRRELELSERPWVSATNFKITTPLRFFGDGEAATMCTSAELNNAGHSVAGHVVFRIFLVGDEEADAATEGRVCAPLSSKDFEHSAGDAIFPNQPVTKTTCAFMKREEIVKAIDIWKKLNIRNEILTPLMIACIDYRFPFEQGHHQSRYAFWVGVPSDGAITTIAPRGTPGGVTLSLADVSAD